MGIFLRRKVAIGVIFLSPSLIALTEVKTFAEVILIKLDAL